MKTWVCLSRTLKYCSGGEILNLGDLAGSWLLLKTSKCVSGKGGVMLHEDFDI